MLEQLTARMDRSDREMFWLELNVRRARYGHVRTRVHKWLLEQAVPYLLVAVSGAVAGGVAALALSATALAGFSLGGLTGLAAGAVAFTRRSGAHSRRLFKDLLEPPDYSPSAASYAAVADDVRRVLSIVASPAEPLVIFVDDLDRCSPRTVAEVIEAINMFLSEARENCVFVLGADPRIIATSLEIAFADLEAGDQLTRAPSEASVGWKFLDKLVQLPLRLPTITNDTASAFLSSLMTNEPLPNGSSTEASLKAAVPTNLDAVRAVAEATPVPTSERLREGRLADGIRILRAEKETILEFRDDDRRTIELVRTFAPYLRGNPREIKRFLNTFRLFASLGVRRDLTARGDVGPMQSKEIEMWAKLAILCVRWPHLIDVLQKQVPSAGGESNTVLELVETGVIDSADLAGHLTEGDVAAVTDPRGPRSLLETGSLIAAEAAFYL
jgi:hypothetical protein